MNTVGSQNGTLYLGGYFTSVDDRPRMYAAAVASASGELLAWNPRPNHLPYVIEPGLRSTFMGGSFTSVGPWEYRNHAAALDLSSGRLLNWDPQIDGYDVRSLAVDGGTLYIGGDFQRVSGSERSGIASFDLATVQLEPWDPHPNGAVWTMALQNRRLFIGGAFTSIGGVERLNAAAFSLPTRELASWNPRASFGVRTVLPSGDRVYVGGFFSEIGGKPRRCLAAVDTAAGDALSWDPDPDSYINAIAVGYQGVVVGGSFSTIGAAVRTGLAVLDATSGRALSWDTNVSGQNPVVYSVNVWRDQVLVGGSFATVGNETRQNLASLRARDGRVTKWQPNPDGPVWSLSSERDDLFVGGSFKSIEGGAAPTIAAFTLRGAHPRTIAVRPGARPFAIAVNHPSPGNAVVRYSVATPMPITIEVFDLQGRKIETLVDGAIVEPGEHELTVETGRLRAGWYVCRLSSDSGTASGRLVVIR